MRVYKTAEIRNVAVAGHGASGKTSLVDALSFVAGTSKRHGAVKDGTALTDYTADEIERAALELNLLNHSELEHLHASAERAAQAGAFLAQLNLVLVMAKKPQAEKE